MKSLFLDAFEYSAVKPAKNETENMKDCLVVLVTFEMGDNGKAVRGFIQEIRRIAKRLQKNNLVLAPFCHLSSMLMGEDGAKSLIAHCKNRLEKDFNLLVSEFGVDKGLKLDINSGKDGIRFREF